VFCFPDDILRNNNVHPESLDTAFHCSTYNGLNYHTFWIIFAAPFLFITQHLLLFCISSNTSQHQIFSRILKREDSLVLTALEKHLCFEGYI